ncbi:MAG: secretin N-terminal domain-containing protein [Phycisphaerales bacterium]
MERRERRLTAVWNGRGATCAWRVAVCAGMWWCVGGVVWGQPEDAVGAQSGDQPPPAGEEQPRLFDAWRKLQKDQPAQPAGQNGAPPGGPVQIHVPVQVEETGGDPAVRKPLGDVLRFPSFTEGVEVSAIVEMIAQELSINIFTDPGLIGQTVVFNGPMEVKRTELLEFLSLLLEQKGFGLTQDRQGWFSIKPAGDVPVNVGEGDFSTTRVIPTPGVRPSAIQTAVTGAISRVAAGGGGTAGSKISFVDELGVIIITDTPRTIRQVEQLVQVIIAEQQKQGLHRFEISNISADLARAKVVELNGGGSASSQMRPNPNQPVGSNVVPLASAALTNLGERLIVDAESNAVIFRGSSEEAARLKEFFANVDVPSKLKGVHYAAGPASRDIAMYGDRRGLGSVSGGAGGSRGVQGFGFGTPQTSATTSTGSGAGFLLSEDASSFVYFGTDAQHAQVRELVEAFAEQARAARVVVEFYKLKYANSEDVADLLNGLLEQSMQFAESPFLPVDSRSRGRNSAAASAANRAAERSRSAAADLGQPGATGDASGASAADGGGGDDGTSLTPGEDIAILPDIARNQVMVKAPVKQQAEFASIIQKLDVRRPQVYIEAQIVAVTSTDDFRFAVETQFTPGQAVLFTNFGLTTAAQGAAADARRNVATGLGGLTAAIIKSDSVPVVINALQQVGDTRIVSSPRLLVNDNEEATLISVREEPFAQTVQGTSTTQTSQGGVAEAGTTLTVKPQISEAGMLNLEYAVELSSFTAASGQSGLQPPKQKENYESIVSLPSDATMVIGGLTTETLRRSVSKVPFLGDIPIIGELFRDTRNNSAKATIYVFIRPVIVRDPSFGDLRLLTRGPMEQMKVKQDTPPLQPALIPMNSAGISPARREDAEWKPENGGR